MASRVISVLATLAIVTAMVAPALAQSSGGSTSPGGGSTTGSGSSPSSAPSATQPGTPIPAPSTESGTPGKTKPSAGQGQPGTSASGTGSSMPSSGTGSTASTPKSGTGMNDGVGSGEVKTAQKALQDKGMDPGPIDGIMGPKTVAALKAFQKDQQLTESGQLDDQTREKLGVPR